jgi:DNA topoisomerase-3
MILIIAEKPLTAEPIAANRKATIKRDGYFEGNGYVVTSGFGHLVELYEPEDYDLRYKHWTLEDLPILPDFKYKVFDEPYRKKRFAIIRKLLQEADEVINACDSDREGENIFWQILLKAGFRDFNKCRRLWVSDYNDGPITEAFKNLKPLVQFKNEYKSAETRQKADWLYGMNLSRLLTKASTSGQWIFGRVQTPTLMIVCDAYHRNQDFKETPYWKIRVSLVKDNMTFYVLSEKSYENKATADGYFQTLQTTLKCFRKEVTEKKENPPSLFSLSALQQEASRMFNLKMAETLAAAQALYEKHKLTTYPRSDSRHLPESLRQDVTRALGAIAASKNIPEPLRNGASMLINTGIGSSPFNDAKVNSHHAIIPTTADAEAKNLANTEMLVYCLIVKQFLQAFMRPCLKKNTRLDFPHGPDVFKSYGSEVLTEGWRILDDALITLGKERTEDQDEVEQKLPNVNEGEVLSIVKKEILEKKTKKPPLLTTATLSRMMATAGKLVEDEELSEAMKECGIGTEATRAEIVKRLYELEYIADQGKYIVPTTDGLKLHELLHDFRISSPELTGLFESKLNRISKGELQQEDFLKDAVQLMVTHMEKLKEKARALTTDRTNKEEVGVKCPVCKDGEVVVGVKSYQCSKAKWKKDGETWTNSGCNFQIAKILAEKKLSLAVVRELVEKRQTKKTIGGFVGKSKKLFSARLVLNDRNKIEFVFTHK